MSSQNGSKRSEFTNRNQLLLKDAIDSDTPSSVRELTKKEDIKNMLSQEIFKNEFAPVHYAARLGKLECLKVMNASGFCANSNVEDEQGSEVPLIFEPIRHGLADKELKKMLEYLLEIGSDPNSTFKGSNGEECAPLFYIILQKSIKADFAVALIDLLADHDADVFSVDNYWTLDNVLYTGSALQAAKKRGDQTIITHMERLIKMKEREQG